MARSPSRTIQRRSRRICSGSFSLGLLGLAQPLGGVEAGLDPLGEVDLLLGVEQRDLADLLEVGADRVGRRGHLGVLARLPQRLGLLLVVPGELRRTRRPRPRRRPRRASLDRWVGPRRLASTASAATAVGGSGTVAGGCALRSTASASSLRGRPVFAGGGLGGLGLGGRGLGRGILGWRASWGRRCGGAALAGVGFAVAARFTGLAAPRMVRPPALLRHPFRRGSRCCADGTDGRVRWMPRQTFHRWPRWASGSAALGAPEDAGMQVGTPAVCLSAQGSSPVRAQALAAIVLPASARRRSYSPRRSAAAIAAPTMPALLSSSRRLDRRLEFKQRHPLLGVLADAAADDEQVGGEQRLDMRACMR